MLVSFSVGNFRSIKEKTTLTMQCKESLANEKIINNFNTPILKNVFIFGANASGKSNIIRALHFMAELCVKSFTEEKYIKKIEPFLLDAKTEKSFSFFEVVFIHQDIKYRYGFELNSDFIHKEWLYYVPTQRETLLFERKVNEINASSKFVEGKVWIEGIEKFGLTLRDDALLISTLNQFFQGKNSDEIISSKIIDFFSEKLTVIPAQAVSRLMRMTIWSLAQDAYTNVISSFMKFADTGIKELESNIEIEEEKHINHGQSEKVEARLKCSFQTKHNFLNGETTDRYLDFIHNESDGTKKIFALSTLIFDALKKEKTLIIDEFSACLHPVLSDKIITFFNQCNKNRNAQLIIVTHDVTLLKDDDIDKTQIYLVEKKDESTQLTKLSDITGIRKTDLLDRNYYSGKYGAIPDLERLTAKSFMDFLTS